VNAEVLQGEIAAYPIIYKFKTIILVYTYKWIDNLLPAVANTSCVDNFCVAIVVGCRFIDKFVKQEMQVVIISIEITDIAGNVSDIGIW